MASKHSEKHSEKAEDPNDQAPIRESQFHMHQEKSQVHQENEKKPGYYSKVIQYQPLPEEERVVREIEQDENIEGNRNTAANNNRIKSVESGEEILRAENIANIVTAEKGNSGIVIRIKSLEKLEYLPAKVYIEIRNQTNLNAKERESILSNTRHTKLALKDNLVWDEDFYYNNSVVQDDNISFILRAENSTELARTEVRNLSSLRKGNKQGEVLQQTEKELVTVDLLKQEDVVAKLTIQISFYEREDILGGVLMPSLSLRPPPDFVGKYNAIDGYKPNFTNKLGSRANCFNFYDGDTISGFDSIEVFPPKFEKKNQSRKVVAAE